MKKFLFTFILILIFGVLVYIFTYRLINNDNTSANYVSNEKTAESIINEISRASIPSNKVVVNSTSEIELANFSTNLIGDAPRLNNITITCNSISGTIVGVGETFSFNEIVGNPSPEKGYQEADVIIDTRVEKGYGGGNCQVSSTLYNICLQIPDIEIIERNPHQKKVSYVEENKDAAVSYNGGLDFKFKNNTNTPIKIYIKSENNQVVGRIVKIS